MSQTISDEQAIGAQGPPSRPALEAIAAAARRLADERLAPLAEVIDRHQTFSEELWKAVFEFGLAGIPYPVEVGGGGGSFVAYAVALEEISRRAAVALHYHSPAAMVARALLGGNPELATRFVPALLSGELRASWAFTEPQTGSDPKQIATRARRVGGDWVISGQKMFITLAPICDIALVFCQTGERLSAICVETDQAGWQPGSPLPTMSFGGCLTTPVALDDVRAPASNLVGDEGDGFRVLLTSEAEGKLRIAAACVGLAQRAQELAVAYALDRTHRGTPIGRKFQTIQWLLGDIGAAVASARALTREVAGRLDAGADVSAGAAAARISAARSAEESASNAMQVHGSYGLVQGSEVERLYREAKFFSVGQGVIELQRIVVARALLDDAERRRAIGPER
ncbi:MAG: acyl-CoA dehydrogenase family protein [Actinomycetota bacterium]